MYLYTRMLKIGALSDSKLLCRFTVIFKFNSIHRYNVTSNIVADKLQKSERFRESWPHAGARALFMWGPTYYSRGGPRTIQAGPTWDPCTIQAGPTRGPRFY